MSASHSRTHVHADLQVEGNNEQLLHSWSGISGAARVLRMSVRRWLVETLEARQGSSVEVGVKCGGEDGPSQLGVHASIGWSRETSACNRKRCDQQRRDLGVAIVVYRNLFQEFEICCAGTGTLGKQHPRRFSFLPGELPISLRSLSFSHAFMILTRIGTCSEAL
jgi:hypothetical protein